MRGLQRITNCILATADQCLMLQKPSRGWWVAPGGKMEHGETIKEAVVREFREETGLSIKDPELRAVTTVVIVGEGQTMEDEWMMFSFLASSYEGTMLDQSPEGKLVWQKRDAHVHLPMAEGDHHVFNHILNQKGVLYGTFYYTKDFKLIDYRLDPKPMQEKGAAL